MVTRAEREAAAERLWWAEWAFRQVQGRGVPDWYRAARAELEEAQAEAEQLVLALSAADAR